ncbi:MAG: HIT family protein [Saprospiraceae bacterium]|uniref:HIT family protein n=1 Tax=Candidatus Defluviibacterium haderslevense TaxID=2981993 RepID=A0A9D7XBY2_9BACT|nr:HIT family protein [Candidatus Defluviibacterium haderslevense]
MASIFSRIISGEIPCYKVAESESCIAFLDVNPLAKGHVLVVPKKEMDYIFDIDDELYLDLFVFAKKVAKAIQKIVPCTKIGMSVIGLEVPHAHIHLVPINNISDLNFSGTRVSLMTSEFIELASQIQDVLD